MPLDDLTQDRDILLNAIGMMESTFNDAVIPALEIGDYETAKRMMEIGILPLRREWGSSILSSIHMGSNLLGELDALYEDVQIKASGADSAKGSATDVLVYFRQAKLPKSKN